MEMREGVFDDPQVVALLTLHADGMLANSPVDKCHFLDLSALQAPDVTFCTLWDGDSLVAMGALRRHDADLGEIKSMRTVPARLGEGYARTMLAHIVATAKRSGLRRLSLETGSGAAFEPALALYRSHSFIACPPFGEYVATDFNQFMSLDLKGN